MMGRWRLTVTVPPRAQVKDLGDEQWRREAQIICSAGCRVSGSRRAGKQETDGGSQAKMLVDGQAGRPMRT
jgi:hypothetical protein